MDRFELDKLIQKTEEIIKVACADACEGANVSTDKWAKLGHDVHTALEALKLEVEAQSKPAGKAGISSGLNKRQARD